jgi:hypothetical protein
LDNMNNVNFQKDFGIKAKGRYKCRVMDAAGRPVYEDREWRPNLILDSGFAKIAHMPWACTFQWCVAGTGTRPVKNVTNTTASQSGTSVSIGTGDYLFTPDDVGRIVYWPADNKQARIVSVGSDGGTATVDVSQAVSASDFVIFDVKQTSLDRPYSMNMGYETGEGLCGYAVSGTTVRMYRTFNFYMELTPVLITELGFLEAPASLELFSRVLLTTPLYLNAGQYLQVSYELSVTLEPSTPVTKTPVIDGWPIAPSTSLQGSEAIQSIGMAVVGNDGVAIPYDHSMLCNEPYAPGTTFLGPYYGYVNRWKNSPTASPVKSYSGVPSYKIPYFNRLNPSEILLERPSRYYKQRYESSLTKNYVCNVTGLKIPTASQSITLTGPILTNETFSNPGFLRVSSPYGSVSFPYISPSQTVYVGDQIFLEVIPLNTPSGSTYQWYKDGVDVSGATGRTFTISEAQLTDAGSYTVQITAPTGGKATSSPMNVTVSAIPSTLAIKQQPVALKMVVGDTGTLSVVAFGSDSPTFQWRKEGVDIPGATSDSLAFPNVKLSDSGTYDVVIVDGAQRVVSDGVKVQVAIVPDTPTVTTQPANVDATSGMYTRLQVVASGFGNLEYQWQKAATPTSTTWVDVSGATSPTLEFNPVLGTDQSYYRCKVTSAALSAGYPWWIKRNSERDAIASQDSADPIKKDQNNVVMVGDCMQPMIAPPFELEEIPNQTNTQWTYRLSSAWNGVDPYSFFPAPVPFTGDSVWDNWEHEFTPGVKEPVAGASVFLSTVSTAHATSGTCVDRSSQCIEVPLVIEPYSIGGSSLIKKGTFLVNIGNRTDWRCLGIGPTDPNTNILERVAASKYNGFLFLFDEPQTKLNSHVLNVFFKYSWTRDLSNA